ncbi:MAG TPA: glycosyltransferase [Methylocystis sp.]|nr:glycosyltransferase [Methylocystis sp.]
MSFPTDRPPRVLMFAPAFAPDFFSEALVNSKLALAMLDAGWEVVVFSAPGGDNVYARGWSEPWSQLREISWNLPPTPRGVFVRLAAAICARHPISGSLWAERTARTAAALHAEKPFDLVLSRSTSCVAHLPALLFRARRRKESAPIWIANWNDPPGHRFPPPYDFPSPPLQRRLMDRYLRAAATAADANTFPSELLRDYLAEPLGLDAEGVPPLRRGVVIPHVGLGWRPRAAPLADLSRFRVSHAGNLSRERDPTMFFAAFAKFAERHPEVRCEIEIVGQLDPAAEAAAAKLGLHERIRLVGGLPYMACLERLAAADLLLLLEAPCARGVFLPSKLIDYIEVGRPILAVSPRIGVVRELIEHHNFGLAAANDSAADIEAALERGFEERSQPNLCRARQRAIEWMRDLVRPDRIVADIRRVAELAGSPTSCCADEASDLTKPWRFSERPTPMGGPG